MFHTAVGASSAPVSCSRFCMLYTQYTFIRTHYKGLLEFVMYTHACCCITYLIGFKTIRCRVCVSTRVSFVILLKIYLLSYYFVVGMPGGAGGKCIIIIIINIIINTIVLYVHVFCTSCLVILAKVTVAGLLKLCTSEFSHMQII